MTVGLNRRGSEPAMAPPGPDRLIGTPAGSGLPQDARPLLPARHVRGRIPA
jgi:hypothetical protein